MRGVSGRLDLSSREALVAHRELVYLRAVADLARIRRSHNPGRIARQTRHVDFRYRLLLEARGER